MLYSTYIATSSKNGVVALMVVLVFPGRFIKQGQMIRAKAQLDQLQSEIASVARKTGISSATKLALLAHHRETVDDEIPAVEWWDQDVLNAKR